MMIKSTRNLIFAASLIFTPAAFQTAFAADAPNLATSSLEKVNAATTAANTMSKINLNTATAEQLTSIKGIGTATASSIIAYRDENGAFSNLADLTNIKGIGAATLTKISPYLSL